MELKRLTPVMKITTRCNLSCSYCYSPVEIAKDMSLETIRVSLEKILAYNNPENQTKIIWHGGEPLIRGIGFFEEIIRIERELENKKPIKNHIQTNGTLLNDELSDFFAEEGFRLGFSLDGPSNCNNERCYRNGRVAFEGIIGGIKLAKDKGIGTGAIAVVTSKNTDRLGEIYQFFRSEGINLKISPLASLEGNTAQRYQVTFGEGLKKLFDDWSQDNSAVSVQPFEDIVEGIISGNPKECTYAPNCQDMFISIDPWGNVFPCGRFSGITEMKLGNIEEEDMESLDNSPQRKAIRMRKLDDCNDCPYVKICNGGCPYETYKAYGDFNAATPNCESNRALFQHVSKFLKARNIETEI